MTPHVGASSPFQKPVLAEQGCFSQVGRGPRNPAVPIISSTRVPGVLLHLRRHLPSLRWNALLDAGISWFVMLPSRRSFLCAAIAPPAVSFGSQDRISSIQAWSDALLPRKPRPAPKFASDDDPARWRWFGPFSLLGGAILVRIRTASGLVGYGLGGGGGAAAYIVENHLRELLVGVNPANVERLWEQMHSSTSFYGRRGLAIMALSGIDLALWDLAGKAAGKPVCELLGGTVKRRVPVYCTGANLAWAVQMGFKAFKLPINEGPQEGKEGMLRIAARVAEARKTVGPKADLMIDCLGRWSVPYTLAMVRRLAEYRLRWIEEPLMPYDVDGYAQLCRGVRGPRIALGEHEYTRFGFEELIRRKAVQVMQPDISWSGGLTELRRIAALARSRSIPLSPHRGGSLYGLHFMAATPGCDLAESFGLGESGTELMQAMTPRYEAGFLHLPDKPGFGVDIQDSWLSRLPRY